MAKDAEGSVLTRRLLELTWKPGKIVLQTEMLIIAYFVLLFARWVAPNTLGAGRTVIIFLGRVIAYFIVLLGMTAVAKMTLAELRGKDPVPAKAAFSAALKKIKDVVASPIKIFALLAGLAVFHAVIDLFGKIPFVGELAWMFSPVFTFPLGIAMVAAILVLVFGAMILPTIIIMGKEGPVSELIDFLRRNTVKFAGHFLIALAVAVITFIILLGALQASRDISQTIMGDKYAYIQRHRPNWLKYVPGYEVPAVVRMAGYSSEMMNRVSALPPAELSRETLAEIFPGQPVWGPKADRWTLVVAGFVFGVLMWLIQMSIWGFIVVNFGVAGTLSYVGLTGESGEKEKAEAAPEEASASKEEEKKPAPAEKPKKAAPKKSAPAEKEEKPAEEGKK